MDQVPEYRVPFSSGSISEQVFNCNPVVESIDLHFYENLEVCVIVKGENSWFARDLQLKFLKLPMLHVLCNSPHILCNIPLLKLKGCSYPCSLMFTLLF